MGAYSNCFAHAFAEAADGACYAAEETWVREGLAVVVRRGMAEGGRDEPPPPSLPPPPPRSPPIVSVVGICGWALAWSSDSVTWAMGIPTVVLVVL